ncbi:MAG TPA: GNAT family N-acetyltransferase [Candidatus Dormibacteraeota bacterium]|jgi:predicted acetyltransferase|nr:GNAT family N-acetyltransferase [Candidatus Dormibacteraeota bacterium]
MDYQMRNVTAEEWPAFHALMEEVFVEEAEPEHVEFARRTAELDRSVGVFDGPQLVATAGIYSLGLRVPGGSLPTAGVTWVTVRSTHRRRGVLTAMMARMLDQAREREEPMAALWAAESVIYGRYGFGAAAYMSNLEIETGHARLTAPAPRGTCRLVDAGTAAGLLPALYDRCTADRPGTLARSEVWWERRLHDSALGHAGGWSKRRHVLYERDGELAGYAIFRVHGDWADPFPANRVRVVELIAADPDAVAGVWGYLLAIDLVTKVEANIRPLDEPLQLVLADPRRLRVGDGEELWLRLLDVPGALAGRRYRGAGAIRIGVEDAFRPEVAGVYELEVAGGGGACRRVDAEPDVSTSIEGLSALYLGSVSPLRLLAAGRLAERRAGDALRLHDLLAWPVPAWCPEIF